MNQAPAEAATAVILAGGKSSRMGQPKALLLFAGEPLIVHMVRRLGQSFSDIVVVAAPDQELPALPATIVRDDVAHQGPVGGIYYGLKAARREICFVTSCDAPFLNLRLIAYLMAQISDFDVVVPFTQDRYQPLHAVYRKQVAPLLRGQLERGELRPIFLYDKVRTRKITEAEMHPHDPESLSFLNMNTPEDYQAALAKWNERQRLETETATPSVADSDTVSVSTSNSSLSLSHSLSPSPWSYSAWPGYSRIPKKFYCRYRKRPRCLKSVRRLRPSTRSCSAESSIRTGVASRAATLATLTGWSLSRIPTPGSTREIKIFILSADAGG